MGRKKKPRVVTVPVGREVEFGAGAFGRAVAGATFARGVTAVKAKGRPKAKRGKRDTGA